MNLQSRYFELRIIYSFGNETSARVVDLNRKGINNPYFLIEKQITCCISGKIDRVIPSRKSIFPMYFIISDGSPCHTRKDCFIDVVSRMIHQKWGLAVGTIKMHVLVHVKPSFKTPATRKTE